jgi:hypothetical protein
MRASLGVVFIAACLLTNGCGSSPATPVANATANDATAASNATLATNQPSDANTASASTPSAWSYDTTKDQMRGTTTYTASIDSENQLTFAFPYKGGNATLYVRQRPEDGLNIIVDIDGQFTCNSFTGGHVSAKFDDGSVQRFGCAEPSDGRTGELFVRNEQRFLSELKHSKKLILEAEFYEQGDQQMIFDTTGLVWPPAQKAAG